MAHPEDVSLTTKAIDQIENLMRESFRMAERIVAERIKSLDWAGSEGKDRYQALMPMMALDIKSQLERVCGIEHASRKQVDEQQTSIDVILAEVRRRNDVAEQRG